jgi:hypothetical protein
VLRRRFRKTNRAAYKTLNTGAQIDGFAFDLLGVLFANGVLLWIDMPLVSAPAVGIEARDAKGFQQRLPLQKDCILPSPKDLREYGPTALIDGMP